MSNSIRTQKSLTPLGERELNVAILSSPLGSQSALKTPVGNVRTPRTPMSNVVVRFKSPSGENMATPKTAGTPHRTLADLKSLNAELMRVLDARHLAPSTDMSEAATIVQQMSGEIERKESAEQRISTLQAALQQHETRLARTPGAPLPNEDGAEIARLKQRLAEAVDQVGAANAALAELEMREHNLLMTSGLVKERVAQFEQLPARLEADRLAQEAQQRLTRAAFDAEQAKVDARQQRLRVVTDKLSHEALVQGEEQERLQKRIAELEAALQVAASAGGSQQEASELRTELAHVQRDADAARAEQAKLTETVQRLEENIAAMTMEKTAAARRALNAEAQAHSAQARASILTAKLAESLVDLAGLQTSLRKVEQELESTRAAQATAQRQGHERTTHLTEQCASLEARKLDLESQLLALSSNVEQLQSTLRLMSERYKRDMEAAQQEHSSLRAQLASVEKRRESLTTQLTAQSEAARGESIELRDRIDMLQASLETMRAEAEAARSMGTPKGSAAKKVVPLALTRIRELQVEMRELHQRLADAEERAVLAESQHVRVTQQLVQARQYACNLEEAVFATEADVVATEESHARVQGAMQRELHDAHTKAATLNATVAHLEAARAAEVTETATLLRRVAALETEVHRNEQGHAADLATLRASLLQHESHRFALSVELEAAREHRALSLFKARKAEARVHRTEAALVALRAESDVLEKTNAAMEQMMESLRMASHEAYTYVATLQATAQASQEELTQAKHTATVAAGRFEAMELELQAARAQLVTLSTQSQALEEENGSLKQSLAESRATHASMARELATEQVALEDTQLELMEWETIAAARHEAAHVAKVRADQLDASLKTLSTRYEAVGREVHVLRAQVSTMRARGQRDDGVVASLEAKLVTAEGRSSSLSMQLSVTESLLQAAIHDGSKALVSLRDAHETHAALLRDSSHVQVALGAAQQQIESLQQRMMEMDEASEETEGVFVARLSAATQQLDVTQRELTEVRERMAAAMFRAARMEKKARHVEEERTQALAHAAYLEQQASSLTSALGEARDASSYLRCQLERLSAAQEGAERQHATHLAAVQASLAASEAQAAVYATQLQAVRSELASSEFRLLKSTSRMTRRIETLESSVASLQVALTQAEESAAKSKASSQEQAAAGEERMALLRQELEAVRDELARAQFRAVRSEKKLSTANSDLEAMRAERYAAALLTQSLFEQRAALESVCIQLKCHLASREHESQEALQAERLRLVDTEQRLVIVQEAAQRAEDEACELRARVANLSSQLAQESEANAVLSDEKASLRKERDVSETHAACLADMILSLEEAKRTLLATQTSLASQLEAARSHASTQGGRVRELEQQVAEMTQRMAALDASLARVTQERAEAMASLEAAENKTNELAFAIDALDVHLEAVETDARGKDALVQQLEDRAASLAVTRDESQAEVLALRERVLNLDAELRAALSHVVEQDETLSHVQHELSGAKRLLPLTFQRVRDLQSEVKLWKEAADESASRHQMLERQVRDGQAALQAKEASQAALRATLAAEQEALSSLRTQLAASEAARQQDANVQEALLGASNALVAAQTAEIKSLSRDKAKKSRRLATMRVTMHDLEAQLLASEEQGSSAQALVTTLLTERNQLRSTIGNMEVEVMRQEDALRAMLHRMEALVGREATFRLEAEERGEQVASLQSELRRMTEDKDRDLLALELLTSQLKAAREEVNVTHERMAALEEELSVARVTGTPKGNAAKQILPRAFDKIKSLETHAAQTREEQSALTQQVDALQSALDEMQRQCEARQQAMMNLEDVSVALSDQKTSLESRVEALHCELASVNHVAASFEAQCTETTSLLEAERETTRVLMQARDALEREAATLSIHVAQAEREAEVWRHRATSLQSDLEEALQGVELREEQVGALSSQLRVAHVTGTPKGNAAKEVVRLTLQRIHEMKSALEAERSRNAALENTVALRQTDVDALQRTLDVTQTALTGARRHEALLQRQRAEFAKERAAMEHETNAMKKAMSNSKADLALSVQDKEHAERLAACLQDQLNHARHETSSLREKSAALTMQLAAMRMQRHVAQKSKEEAQRAAQEAEAEAHAAQGRVDRLTKEVDSLRLGLQARDESLASLRMELTLAQALVAEQKRARSEAVASRHVEAAASAERMAHLALDRVRQVEMALEAAQDRARQLEEELATCTAALRDEAASAASYRHRAEGLERDVEEARVLLSETEERCEAMRVQCDEASSETHAAVARALAAEQAVQEVLAQLTAAKRDVLAAREAAQQATHAAACEAEERIEQVRSSYATQVEALEEEAAALRRERDALMAEATEARMTLAAAKERAAARREAAAATLAAGGSSSTTLSSQQEHKRRGSEEGKEAHASPWGFVRQPEVLIKAAMHVGVIAVLGFCLFGGKKKGVNGGGKKEEGGKKRREGRGGMSNGKTPMRRQPLAVSDDASPHFHLASPLELASHAVESVRLSLASSMQSYHHVVETNRRHADWLRREGNYDQDVMNGTIKVDVLPFLPRVNRGGKQ